MSSQTGKIIEEYIKRDQWKLARRAIKRELPQAPHDHWLWTCLALTYYEERQYKKALHYSRKALALAPRCPLVLWDYAGALHMTGQEEAAIRICRRLLRRGVHSVAYGRCGEGLPWARTLLNDCRYSIGHSYSDLGKRGLAARYLRRYIAHRRRGVRSIYNLRDVKRELIELTRATKAGRRQRRKRTEGHR